MENLRVINKIIYQVPKIGISMVTYEELDIIGERIILIDGVIHNQYLFTTISCNQKDRKSFITEKENIILRNEDVA